MLMPYRFLAFPKFTIFPKHYVSVQARPSCFVQSFLSSFGKDVFTEPSTAARSEMRKNVHFPVFFSSMSTKKDPEELLLQGLLYAIEGWPAMQN